MRARNPTKLVTKSILYLHGVRNDDPEQQWRDALDATLRRSGIKDVGSRGYRIIAPTYLDLLEVARVSQSGAASAIANRPTDSREKLNAAARSYFVNLSRLERALDDAPHQHPSWMSRVPSDLLADPAIKWKFSEAQRYCEDPKRRRAIISRVLEALPRRGELIILAHSLGSVVAADLLYHLGRDTRVRLLITLGSPLGITKLREHLVRIHKRFPFEVVDAWMNVMGSRDGVTAGPGLNRVFPEVLDIYVDTGDWRNTHLASSYLDQDVLARAIHWTDEAHDGGQPAALLPDERVPDEVLALSIGFQYGLRLEQCQQKGEARTKFAGARKLVADEARDKLSEMGYKQSILDRLSYDNAAFLEGRLGPEVAIQRLVGASMISPIQPYEIRLKEEVRGRALEDLAQDLGFPASFGKCAISAERQAREAQDEGFDPMRAGIALLGFLVVIAAPAMVFVAAPTALVGGAAFVGGLAALGPGGMLGGLAVVGTLGGVGGATAAKALSVGTHAAVLENVVYLHALAIAADQLDLDDGERREWLALSKMESELAREQAKLSKFSDLRAPRLLEVEKKLDSVRRALKAMREKGLAPKEQRT